MKRSIKFALGVSALVLISACSSSSKKDRELEEVEHSKIERDYVVRDASSKYRPGWIEDAEVWAKEHGKDHKKFRFFSFETEPKVSRGIACNLAKVNAKADIAGEISTFIDKKLSVSQDGTASINENDPSIKALREYVENTLAEKIIAKIQGAAIIKTYWEKRQYKAELGAKKDFKAYTCAVYIRMNSKLLAKSIDQATKMIVDRSDDPSIKASIKKVLEKAALNFEKSKKGEI